MVPVLFAVVRAGEIVAVGSRPEMQAFAEAYRGRSQNVPFSQVSIEPVEVRVIHERGRAPREAVTR